MFYDHFAVFDENKIAEERIYKKPNKIEIVEEIPQNGQISVVNWNCGNQIRKIGITCKKGSSITPPILRAMKSDTNSKNLKIITGHPTSKPSSENFPAFNNISFFEQTSSRNLTIYRTRSIFSVANPLACISFEITNYEPLSKFQVSTAPKHRITRRNSRILTSKNQDQISIFKYNNNTIVIPVEITRPWIKLSSKMYRLIIELEYPENQNTLQPTLNSINSCKIAKTKSSFSNTPMHLPGKIDEITSNLTSVDHHGIFHHRVLHSGRNSWDAKHDLSCDFTKNRHFCGWRKFGKTNNENNFFVSKRSPEYGRFLDVAKTSEFRPRLITDKIYDAEHDLESRCIRLFYTCYSESGLCFVKVYASFIGQDEIEEVIWSANVENTDYKTSIAWLGNKLAY